MKTGTDGSVQIQESTEGGMEIIKKKKKEEEEEEINKGKRLSAVRQVLKPPAHPALPSLLKPHPLPSRPLLGRGGESTWAQDGVETRRKHSTHGWRLSY